ncbi:MAG: 2Fe-2S iron-sulfur cluster-binding protein [Coriobacteriales bacterium]
MAEKLTITIDGTACECKKGEYLYDVALRNGIFIPVLCRSDAFPEHRACCRVCIVEVVERGWSKVVTSCIYPVEREVEVFTQSERIREERAVIFGLLAARAPRAEGIGALSAASGSVGRGRFVTLPDERCVLCGLCVQACDSLGTGAISTVMRGTEKEVDTPYGKASADCIGCLSCANVCPTGKIGFFEDDDSRSIWGRVFELARCDSCGAVLGTPQQLAYSTRGHDSCTQCDECRRQQMADELMRTYRNV